MSNPIDTARATAVPTVTVCIPSYNKERFVELALDSVSAQTFQDFELIVIDDCSVDRSVQIIEEWVAKHGRPCRLVKHETNRGLCRTLNEALGMARGRYLALLAADDLWLPRFLERFVARMEDLPATVAVLYGDLEVIDENGDLQAPYTAAPHRRYPRPPEGRIFDILFKDVFIRAPAFLLRPECLRAVGGYDETLYYEDRDMWLRLAHEYSFAFLPETLAQYRLSAGSISRSRSGRLGMLQAKLQIDQKWRGVDPAIDKMLDERLRAWSRVEALYMRADRAALGYGLSALRRTPKARGLAMVACMAVRLPHKSFWKLDGWARAGQGSFRKVFRGRGHAEGS